MVRPRTSLQEPLLLSGAIYHVMSRGDQREDIFPCDVDRYGFGIQKDTPLGRREFERRLEQRCLVELDQEELEKYWADWCLGSPAIRKEYLGKLECDKIGENHPGEIRREPTEAKAERFIRKESAQLGGSPQDVIAHARNDRGKLAMAARLRQETTLSIKQNAERLHLGKPKRHKNQSVQTPQPSGPHQL
ncbi:MAG: hypothetical protein JWM16_2209 [Verrucomicrobiales bacterium]|nr:hypothetical protein [Verrucomicrobiales bacterium]